MIKKGGIIILLICGVFFLTHNLESAWTFKRLTWNAGGSCYPAIATDTNNHIHVVWSDGTPGNLEIFYKKSTDGGANWTFKRLTWNSSQSYYPAIATDSNNHIHVVWRDGIPGSYEIFYKISTDGASWNFQRLTWNPGNSTNPAIAADSDNHIHVVWQDTSPGHWEIFYKKKD
jgi:hypothetical protein